MTAMISILLLVPTALIFVLALFFAFEVAGAILPDRKRKQSTKRPTAITVIIPAHNEGENLTPTIADVKAQLTDNDRVIVVADNCSDNTANIAIASGAECLVRNNENQRGKGFALQFALDDIKDNPPEIVVFVDADCRLGEGAIEKVSMAALATMRPAQALYLMRAPEDAPQRRVAEFAWALINRVRMSGLYNLFDTTRLTGAGMALPWTLAQKLNVGSGEIVEDLSLSLDLTREGAAPIYVGDALVTSEFPANEDAAAKQRARWEHGSMRMAKHNLWGLFFEGVKRGDTRLIAMAFDLAIPPLTVFAMVLIVSFAATAAALVLFNIAEPFILVLISSFLFAGAVVASWLGYGRNALPVSAVKDIAGYVVSKRKVYDSAARQTTETWTRTERAQKKPAKSEH